MNTKKLISLIVITVMLFSLLAACGVKEEPSGNTPTDPDDDSPAVSSDTPDISDTVEDVNFWIPDLGTDVSDYEAIESAINEISEKEIGVRINLTFISVGDYGTQLYLAIANKEAVDIATFTPIDSSSWMNFYANGSMMDISTLLDSHGADIKELFGEEIINATRVDSGIYGLSNYRMLNSNLYLCYRTDVLDEAGVTADFENMTSWSDFEAVMQAISDSAAGMYPIGGSLSQPVTADGAVLGADKFTEGYVWDELGDTLGIIFSDQAGNVSNTFKEADIVAKFKKGAEWYSAGYVYPDSAISQETTEALIMQKVFAGYLVFSEYGIEANKSQACGTDMSCKEIIPGMITSRLTRNWGMFIPSSAQNPEAAMKFLNLLYTSEEIMTLIDFGIEGQHYEIRDGVGVFPDGKDISNSGYHIHDFALGNQFLAIPWVGSTGGATFRDDALANFLAAPRSVYSGFSADASAMSSTIAALSSVIDEYYYQISNGLYTDSLYEEFLKKLDSAGAEEYIALYADSLGEFLNK